MQQVKITIVNHAATSGADLGLSDFIFTPKTKENCIQQLHIEPTISIIC